MTAMPQVRTAASLPVVDAASKQWAKRPDDQRFLSLADLDRHVTARYERSFSRHIHQTQDVHVETDESGELYLNHSKSPYRLNHYSLAQLASHTRVPMNFLTDNAELEGGAGLNALNLSFRLQNRAPNGLLWVHGPSPAGESSTLAALTSASYGRLPDSKVVQTVRRFVDGATNTKWKVPAASYAKSDPLRATTLYASDRDVFIFLVDEDRPIEFKLPNGAEEKLFRGFYVWNSETGHQKFGLSTFLYRYVCDNRNIWGVKDFTELTIRHNRHAPFHFSQRAVPELTKYAQASAQPIIDGMREIAAVKVDDADDAMKILMKKSFPKGTAEKVVGQLLEDGNGQTRGFNLYDLWNAATRSAQNLSHTDARITAERLASRLVD